MIQNLAQIEYCRGMLDKVMKSLLVKVRLGARIPADVRKVVNEKGLPNFGGVYGGKNAGDPVEYNHLKLVLTDD